MLVAGLVPAAPVMWHGRASLSGVAGASTAIHHNFRRT